MRNIIESNQPKSMTIQEANDMKNDNLQELVEGFLEFRGEHIHKYQGLVVCTISDLFRGQSQQTRKIHNYLFFN